VEGFFDIVLMVLGVLVAGIGVGSYLRKRGQAKIRADLPPEKPPADVVAPPVPEIAPTPSEVKELDDRARETDEEIADVIDLEDEIENTPSPPNEPDSNVVDFLRRQKDDEDE